MSASQRFEGYMAHLAGGLGHVDRHAGLKGYCTGLMLPLSRKSVEPMAARVDPLHASARHQSLHHFVAHAEWSDGEMLQRVAQWVVPKMDLSRGGFWIIDDTGFPKQGKHSVGVARQYCGMLGKQDNCQVAVSVSLANEQASVPVAYRLYLPKEWADDPVRRKKAGVPAELTFATKPEIALQQLEALLAEGAPKYCVLADAGYGVNHEFRQRLTALDLPYIVGITSVVAVWPPALSRCRPSLTPEWAAPLSCHAGQPDASQLLSRIWPMNYRRAPIKQSVGVRGRTTSSVGGLRRFVYGTLAATSEGRACNQSNGCWSNGRPMTPNRSNTIYRRYPKTFPSMNSWLRRICAGASSATIRI